MTGTKLKAQIKSIHAPQPIEITDSLFVTFHQDTVSGSSVTENDITTYFYKTLVFLSPFDTISYYTHISRYYKDQFLELYNDRKIFPASRIYGFIQAGKFYRTAHPGNRNHVFAERLINDKMSLFAADRFIAEGELDVIGTSDSGNTIYNNTQLILDENRKKTNSYDKDYFVTVKAKTDSLILFDKNSEVLSIVKPCKPAYNYYMKFREDRYKEAISTTGWLFVGTMFANFLFNTRFTIYDKETGKLVPLGVLAIATGVTFVTLKIVLKVPDYDKEKKMKTVALYNECK